MRLVVLSVVSVNSMVINLLVNFLAMNFFKLMTLRRAKLSPP